jgi:hypothetical protein
VIVSQAVIFRNFENAGVCMMSESSEVTCHSRTLFIECFPYMQVLSCHPPMDPAPVIAFAQQI